LHDYKAIAKLAKLSGELENEDLMDHVRAWIEAQPNWLLVLDNADALHHFGEQYASHSHDNSKNLHSFIPRGPTGTILWTTRDGRIVGDLVGSKQGINVGSMDASEARELFVGLSDSAITNDDTLAIDELIHKLDRLPLAISQAAAYIRRTSTAVQDYAVKFNEEKRRWKLLEESKFDRHRRPNVPNSVMKTWQISIDYIREENPRAYTILHVIAYFHNQNIPFELIKAAVRSNGDQEDDKNEYNDDVDTESNEIVDDDDVVEAATRLKEFSFLRFRNSKSGLRSYEMHKLVQEATRYALEKIESEIFSKSALEIMLKLFPTSNHNTWDRCEVYLPHAITVSNCLEVSQEKILVPDLLDKISGYLHDQLRSREKEPVDLKAFRLRKEELGEKHPDTIRSMANLATTYHQQGRSKEAEEIEIEVLALRKEVLGEKHPDTILSMANLATTYHQQGRSKEAEEIDIEVLTLRKEVLSENHPHTILSMANLATTYHQQGRLKEAEEIKVKVLALQKEVLGEKHPDTILSMANLATTYYQQGRSNEAEEIYIEVLVLQKEVLGEKHPDTINSMASLATTYQMQGRSKEAAELLIKALLLQREVVGERHPDTISSITNLAMMYDQQGRSKEAEELYNEALTLRREVLGQRHPDTISIITDIAMMYDRQGRSKEAEEIRKSM
jgi:tetratricopeptide (TPR) repeat protein